MKSVETLKEIIAKRAASWQLTFRRGDRTLNLVVND